MNTGRPRTRRADRTSWAQRRRSHDGFMDTADSDDGEYNAGGNDDDSGGGSDYA